VRQQLHTQHVHCLVTETLRLRVNNWLKAWSMLKVTAQRCPAERWIMHATPTNQWNTTYEPSQ